MMPCFHRHDSTAALNVVFCYLFATIGLVDHYRASQPRRFAEFRDRN
jgi:hypothetical protein